MKHKVSELEGTLLDAAVALAEGYEFGAPQALGRDGWMLYPLSVPGCETIGSTTRDPQGEWSSNVPRFSRDWARGGQLIERERIGLAAMEAGGYFMGERQDGQHWIAHHPRCSYNEMGDTPLIAACRAFVASKFGAEVELP